MAPITRALRWLPALAWTAVLLALSGEEWASERTAPRVIALLGVLLPWASPDLLGSLHWLTRKAGHVTGYGALAALWTLPLAGWRLPLALAVATALIDEARQFTTVLRDGSVADALLDACGAAVGLALARAGLVPTASWLADILIVVAAAGGLALLAGDLAAGLPAGWLWLTTPLALLALGMRYASGRGRRAPPRPR